jgi:hypothetical protein
VLALAGCATKSDDPAAPAPGVVVETTNVIVTGSHIPIKVPKNAIARPETPISPVVSLTTSDTVPFQGPAAAPAGPAATPH